MLVIVDWSLYSFLSLSGPGEFKLVLPSIFLYYLYPNMRPSKYETRAKPVRNTHHSFTPSDVHSLHNIGAIYLHLEMCNAFTMLVQFICTFRRWTYSRCWCYIFSPSEMQRLYTMLVQYISTFRLADLQTCNVFTMLVQ